MASHSGETSIIREDSNSMFDMTVDIPAAAIRRQRTLNASPSPARGSRSPGAGGPRPAPPAPPAYPPNHVSPSSPTQHHHKQPANRNPSPASPRSPATRDLASPARSPPVRPAAAPPPGERIRANMQRTPQPPHAAGRSQAKQQRTPQDVELLLARRRALAEYHQRPQQTISYPLKLLHAPVVNPQKAFMQSLCFLKLFCPFLKNPFQRFHFDPTNPVNAGSPSLDSQGPAFPRSSLGYESYQRHRPLDARVDPLDVPESAHSTSSNLSRLLFHCCCLQCAIAQQTALVHYNRELYRLTPQVFCCDWFFGGPEQYCRNAATMIMCDIFSLGIPCCLCFGYRGIGTMLFGWRARYLLRCRYGLGGTSVMDLFSMLACPILAVDQQETELECSGLHEFWSTSPNLTFYALQ